MTDNLFILSSYLLTLKISKIIHNCMIKLFRENIIDWIADWKSVIVEKSSSH